MALSKKGKKNKKLRSAAKRQEKRKKQEQNAEVRKQDRIAEGLPPVAPKPPKHKTKWAGVEAPLPPPQLIDLLHEFLRDYKYIKAAHGVRTDNQKRPGHNMMLWKGTSIGLPHLNEIFTQWKSQNPELAIADYEKGAGQTAAGQTGESSGGESTSSGSDSNSDSDSDSDASDSDISSDSDGESEIDDLALPDKERITQAKTSTAAAAPSLKRKAAELSSETPDSDSISESDSSSGTSGSSASSSSSGSDSSADLEPARGSKRPKLQDTAVPAPVSESKIQQQNAKSKGGEASASSASESSSSESDSRNDSESDSESSSSVSASDTESARKVPALPKELTTSELRNNSASDSSATLQNPKSPGAKSLTKKAALSTSSEESSSSSSESESDSSSSSDSDSDSGAEVPLRDEPSVPEPNGTTKRKAASPVGDTDSKRVKAENKPFSRIPEDFEVEDRFKSNEYVPYDYANRSHETLSAVRGKGFTKEKNKKKRGQGFRGGQIDIGPSRGVKFED